MRRLLAALVAAAALLTSACGGSGGAQEATTADAPTPDATAAPTAAATATDEDPSTLADLPPADDGDPTDPTDEGDAGGAGGANVGSGAPATPVDLESIHPLPAPSSSTLPVTVTSADGVEVEVTDISRIIPLSVGVAEIVYSLGLGDHVVARDVATTFAEAADLPLVTNAHDVAVEGVLSLRPTVVLGDDTTGPPEALQQLRGAGVPVVLFEAPYTLEDVSPRIRAVAEALGVPEAGEALVERTEAEIAAARVELPEGQEPPRVAFLYLRGRAGIYLIGGDGSGADSLIEAVGARDAGTEAGLQNFTPITPEALITAAPDVILTMTLGLESVGGLDGIVEIPGIAQTPAGQNGRIIHLEDGLLLSFGPRVGRLLELLAREISAAVGG